MAEKPDGGRAPTPPEPEAPDTSESAWWQLLLVGVGLMVGGGFIWWYLDNMERGEGPRRINAILALLYNLGGKTLCVAVVGGLGGIFTILGVVALIRHVQSKRGGDDEEEEDDDES